ncbi:DUF1772 domain-containing protein [Runella sp.]|uniref:anthrone oxygenase family protein n=1 Tax=Runella sp. TaxID=1960881 RepID=UPI003D0F3F87
MLSFQNISLFITTLFSGLIAGLMYSYSYSVNNGLKALPDEAYLRAMQSINIAIQNPYFFSCFLGLVLLYPIASRGLYTQPPATSFYLMLTATALYLIGVFGITVFGNVPLNNQLATFDISKASQNDLATMRSVFENAWNQYHFIRTVAAILAFGCTILALFKNKF